MSEHGTPRRTATEDANAGIVNPPAKRAVARTQTAETSRKTTLSSGLSSFGQSLGKALESRLGEEVENINEQRRLDASIRQGSEHSINQIDAVKKSTGWEKAIFGENAEYREAQQRAVTNGLTDTYLDMATKIDNHAGDTPEEYAQLLKGNLDTVLENYKDDPDTKRMAAAAWNVHSAKLAAKQNESHYAYNQTQQRETFEKQTQQTFDTWTVNGSMVVTPNEASSLMNEAQMFFEGKTKPTGMTDVAWRGAVNNQLAMSLKDGNIGAYNAAKMNGWVDKLNASETATMDRALDVYEGKYKDQVNLAYDTAEMGALSASTPEEAIALYDGLITSLGVLEKRGTGSRESLDSLSRGSYSDILGQRESSGNYRAKNRFGYSGKYQFGGSALKTVGYKNADGSWSGKDGVNSEEDWFNNKEAQDKAVVLLADSNRKTLERKGAMDYVGTTLEGVRITEQGLLAASHLVGAGAVNKMLKSGKIPKDGNGTTAVEYLKLFEGAQPAEAAQVTEEVKEALVGLDDYATGSQDSVATRTKTTVRALRAKRAIQNNMDKYRDKLAKQTAEKMAKQERYNDLKESVTTKDTSVRAGILNRVDPKSSELEEVLDTVILEDINRMVASNTPLNAEDATKVVLAQPEIMKFVAERLKGQEVKSVFAIRAAESFINGFEGHVDEGGKLNEQGKVAMQSIAQLAANEDRFKSDVGTAAFDKYEMIRRGLHLGQTVDQVQKHIDAYSKNVGNRDAYAIQWELQKGETKKSRIESLINKYTGQQPTPAARAHYQEEYDRALIIYQGDRKSAENYLYKSAMNAATNYNGRVIEGGKHLNDVTKYNLKDLLDGAQKAQGTSPSLMTPVLRTLNPAMDDPNDEKKWPRTLDDLQGVEMYVVDGMDGFYIDSLNAQAPVRISSERMRQWADTLEQKNNFGKMLKERDKKDTVEQILYKREQNKLFK